MTNDSFNEGPEMKKAGMKTVQKVDGKERSVTVFLISNAPPNMNAKEFFCFWTLPQL